MDEADVRRHLEQMYFFHCWNLVSYTVGCYLEN